ncbi:Ionotropic receptor 105 [Hyalella azteca]|uniref:Ionotropic receptor 105 n=1 Tax=Hyalella azteca TaxID=294128 RepID=A0A6A0GSE9_HYAAZ|nr:Ionotropic receptor 105 [Hyalella azteca]
MRAAHLRSSWWLIVVSVYLVQAKFRVNLEFDETLPAYATILENLITKTLSNENIIFLYDREVRNFVNLDDVSRWASDSLNSSILISLENLRDVRMTINKNYLRGSSLIVILLYHRDPKPFLDIEASSMVWDPENFILLGVESEVSSLNIFRHKLIQRSLLVTSIEHLGADEGRFDVYQMRHIIPGKGAESATKIRLGTYTPQNFANKAQLFGNVHYDLAGGVMSLATWCDDKPFIHLYPGKTECEGVSLDLLSIIAQKYGFSYNVQLKTADGRWGSKVNGTWNGMFADLMYNGKHLTINYFLLTEERYSDFDTTYPYFNEGFGFVLRKPPPLPAWRGLYYPFSTSVWILFIFTTAIVIVLVTAVLFITKEGRKSDSSVLMVLAAVIRVHYRDTIRKTWVMLWMLCWRLAVFVLSLAYTSNLVAFLTVPVTRSKIQTVDELAASNLRPLMQDYGSFLPGALRISEDPSLRTLGNRFDIFPYEYNSFTKYAFPKVLADTHALVDIYSYLYLVRYESNMVESTYFMREKVLPGYLTWILPKNTAYTIAISNALQRFVESGIVQKLYRKHMVEPHDQETASEWEILRIEHLQGPFIILAFGLLLSLIAFAAERIYEKHSKEIMSKGETAHNRRRNGLFKIRSLDPL